MVETSAATQRRHGQDYQLNESCCTLRAMLIGPFLFPSPSMMIPNRCADGEEIGGFAREVEKDKSEK